MLKDILGSKKIQICSAFITQILQQQQQQQKNWFLTLFIKIHFVRNLKAEEYTVASET